MAQADGDGLKPAVLLVENDEDARLIYRTVLAGAGLEVVTVGNGAAGLRVASIIRDYGMFERREAPQYYPEIRRETPRQEMPKRAATR